MSDQRFDYAHNQYYIAIINDGPWYDKLQKLLKQDNVKGFSNEVDFCIARLCSKYSLDELSITEKVYVRLTAMRYMLSKSEAKELFEKEPILHNNYVEFCRTNKMIWLIDNLLDLPVVKAKPQPETPQPETTQEKTMASVEIKTITYINDADVTKLTDAQLIDAIKTIEAEVADLSGVKTQSAKIKAKIDSMNETLAKVVAILDAR